MSAGQGAWWDGLPYARYVALEQSATVIRDYSDAVFPGLLQSPGYARAIHKRTCPPADPEVTIRQVETRALRQRMLATENTPVLDVIVDEAVLYREVGGTEVMAGQLEHALTAAMLPSVTVRVLPFCAGAHPALNSPFTLLETGCAFPLVYTETLAGPVYRECPDDARLYGDAWEALDGMAFRPAVSAELLRCARDRYLAAV